MEVVASFPADPRAAVLVVVVAAVGRQGVELGVGLGVGLGPLWASRVDAGACHLD
ncbi:hypothetical protein ACFWDQ_37510 [Streptomyces sp. NPDC060053]|uniref:hypothetical protein n=1 Tax=Streptomyces sp. NPDC060053 TaxID=3347047 RepID=UPI0036A469BF